MLSLMRSAFFKQVDLDGAGAPPPTWPQTFRSRGAIAAREDD